MITTATGLCVAIYGTCCLPLKEDHNFNPFEISYDNSPKESSTTDQQEPEQSKSRAETLKQSLDIEQRFYEEHPIVEVLSTDKKKTDQSQKDHQLIEHARMIA